MKSQRPEVRGQRSEGLTPENVDKLRMIIESSPLLPDGWEFGTERKIEIKAACVLGDGGDGISVEVSQNGGEWKEIRVLPYQVLCLTHKFTASRNFPSFPMKITHKGQTYLLNETKAGKLILTK